jgi:hypothetical protein
MSCLTAEEEENPKKEKKRKKSRKKVERENKEAKNNLFLEEKISFDRKFQGFIHISF